MRVFFALVLTAASTAAFANHECRFSADRNFDIDPAGLKKLALVLGSSDAHVDGVAAGKRIEVRAKACASEEEWLKNLTVEQERSGDSVRLIATQNHSNHVNLFGSSYAYIDIEIRLPAALAVDIDAGSGDAKVSNVAALTFSSGSGDLAGDHVGDTVVKVGSGDVVVDDIGNLTVERAGSGDIRAVHVRGEIKVGHVGSGDVNFRDVHGGVRVESVGSGDVIVDRAGGDVVIGSIGSGDVTVDGIGGNFVVHSAGSGDLRHHDVRGKIDVPARHDYD